MNVATRRKICAAVFPEIESLVNKHGMENTRVALTRWLTVTRQQAAIRKQQANLEKELATLKRKLAR